MKYQQINWVRVDFKNIRPGDNYWAVTFEYEDAQGELGLSVDNFDTYQEAREHAERLVGVNLRDIKDDLKLVIVNENNEERAFDANVVINLMDQEIKEIIEQYNFQTDQEFLDLYCELHLKKFGTRFVIN